jgi:Flp pilus assembly pilin Flp
VLKTFIEDDSGQDLVEYGFLVSAIVIGTIALFPEILTAMTAAFAGWGTNAYTLSYPLDPGASY